MFETRRERALRLMEAEARWLGAKVFRVPLWKVQTKFGGHAAGPSAGTYLGEIVSLYGEKPRLKAWLIAYDREHPHAAFILAHELGHIRLWMSEPEALIVYGINCPNSLKDPKVKFPVAKAIALWHEVGAWDMGEVILRRCFPRYDREAFVRYREECLDTYRSAK